MSRDQLVIVFVSLTAAAMAVVVWVFVLHPSRVVHDRTVLTTPIVSSPLTPLPRDSGPKNNPRTKAGGSGSSTSSEAPKPEQAAPAVRKSPPRSKRRPKPATTHKRPAAPQQPTPGGQAPPPPAQPRPPVSATVPVPVTVCTRLATVNC